jgi:hypothetical protein
MDPGRRRNSDVFRRRQMTVERTLQGSLKHALRPESVEPDLARMNAWLSSPAVVSPDGAVASWVNPAHPGYAYPEAAALWLSHFAFAGKLHSVSDEQPGRAATCAAVADWLCARVHTDGGLGRDGLSYLFDSAVGLAAFVRYASGSGWSGPVEETAHRLFRYIERGIRHRVPVSPPPDVANRWSLRFDPHLIKVSLSLFLYGEATGTEVGALVEELISAAGGLDGERWIDAGPDTYTHALCYAVEGLIVLQRHGFPVRAEAVLAVLDELASMQREDGSLPAFLGGGESRTDATSQALRCWTLWAPERYASARNQALRFLADSQSASGGLVYAPGSSDVNAWATLFAVQAIEWQRVGAARLDRLL